MNEVLYSNKHEIEIESNKIYVQITSVVQSAKPIENITLLLDTGAFITLVDKMTAELNNYDIFMRKGCKISGFSEKGLWCDLRKIPVVIFGGFTLYDVMIATPCDDVEVSSVLGMNILENFNFGIDFNEQLVYLSKRSNVVSQKPKYRCGIVSLQKSSIEDLIREP